MTLIDAFMRSAADNAARVAVIDGARELDYAAVSVLLRRAARKMDQLTDRTHVGLYLPASAGFNISLLAALACGRTAVPLNLFLSGEELSALIDHSGIDLVITCPELAAGLPRDGCAMVNVEELIAGEQMLEPVSTGDDDTAVLLYTSGSTGRPRGVCLSHTNLLSNATGSAEAAGFGPDDRVLGALPPFHTFALTTTVLAPMLSGASVVNLPRFNPEAAVDLISARRISVALGVPSMFRLMARAQQARPRDVTCLRAVVSGGERLPARIRAAFEQAFGVEINEGYGLTECSPVVAINRPGANRPGTVGQPLHNLEVRIAGERGQELSPGEDGEILVRGDSVMRGYYRDGKATAEVLDGEGWLHTGDMGRMDADGYLEITGRIKELIIVGGENVHPGEVEAAVTLHPGVAEACVLGVPDRQRGEQVVAAVVSAGEDEPDGNDIRKHCRERLAGYKVPRKIVVMKELPKGPTGKVNRRALAGLISDGAAL